MTTLVKCVHAPSTDPRREGICVKCGRHLPEGFLRSPEREQKLLARVSNNAELRDVIYSLVTDRMGVDAPWQNLSHRKFRRERMEEALDLIAYTFGEADQRLIHGYENELSTSDLLALYHTVQAIKALLMPTDD